MVTSEPSDYLARALYEYIYDYSLRFIRFIRLFRFILLIPSITHYTMSTDARDSLSPPPPAREGQRLHSGRLRTLPITAGDQGDPQGGDDTVPPDIGNDVGFTLASSASGPRTTPIHLAVVVEGTPLRQVNPFAGGSYSSLEEEDDSPPLLDLPTVLEQFASAALPTMAAASDPDPVEAVLGAITELE